MIMMTTSTMAIIITSTIIVKIMIRTIKQQQ